MDQKLGQESFHLRLISGVSQGGHWLQTCALYVQQIALQQQYNVTGSVSQSVAFT
jgi:hypothetical protein